MNKYAKIYKNTGIFIKKEEEKMYSLDDIIGGVITATAFAAFIYFGACVVALYK